MKPENGQKLFQILIVEIVTVSISTFAYALSNPEKDNRLPLTGLLLVESSETPKMVNDGSRPIYIYSSRVSIANSTADVDFSTFPDFSDKTSAVLTIGKTEKIRLNKVDYLVGFSVKGRIMRGGHEAREYDAIMLDIRRLDGSCAAKAPIQAALFYSSFAETVASKVCGD